MSGVPGQPGHRCDRCPPYSSRDFTPQPGQPVPPDHTEVAHARGYREGVRNESARWDAEREALVAVAQAAHEVLRLTSEDNLYDPLALASNVEDIPNAFDALRAALARLNQGPT